MSNNTYFLKYYFNIILSTDNDIVGCFINRGASRHLKISIYFKIGLGLDGFILVFILEIFLSTFAKMVDFQIIKDSTDTFLFPDNFALMACLLSTMFSLHFFSIYDPWFPLTRTFTKNFVKFFIFNYL